MIKFLPELNGLIFNKLQGANIYLTKYSWNYSNLRQPFFVLFVFLKKRSINLILKAMKTVHKILLWSTYVGIIGLLILFSYLFS